MVSVLDNANPTVYSKVGERIISPEEEDEDVVDVIDNREVFDIL